MSALLSRSRCTSAVPAAQQHLALESGKVQPGIKYLLSGYLILDNPALKISLAPIATENLEESVEEDRLTGPDKVRSQRCQEGVSRHPSIDLSL